MPEIVITGMTRRYGTFTALQDLSLTVREGELVTLLGPSGCGKSTTLAALAGLDRPDGGSIRVGEALFFDAAAGIHVPPERRDCGMVFQSYALWPHMTVAENCAFPLRLRHVPKGARQERVAEALALVEMGHLAARYPHELSGGQQQRVALARTLVFRPRVLLLDEPLSNLDAKLRERARIWLKALHRKIGLTTILVTHDQGEALAMSDRIVVMNAGRIEQIDTPRGIYERPASRFVADFIGEMNFIAGRAEPGAIILPDGQRVATETGAPAGDVTLAVRPRRIAIAATGPLSGRVIETTYLGSSLTSEVELAGQRLRVETDGEPAAGPVRLQIDTTGATVFPGLPA